MIWLLRALRMLCELLPTSWSRCAGMALGDGVRVLGIRRRVVARNMHLALGLEPGSAAQRRLLRDSYRHMGESAIEFMRMRRLIRCGGLASMLQWYGEEHLHGPWQGGQVLLTAHQGNFTLFSAAAALRGYPVTVVIKRVRNQSIEQFWLEQLEHSGLKILGNRDSMGDILRVLRRDEMLGFVYDQHDSREGVWVDFMGHVATAFRAVPILAGRSPRPVVPVYITRLPNGQHRIDCCPPIACSQRDGESAEDYQARCAQAYTDSIAAAVRRCPAQWMWLHNRWRPYSGKGLVSERAQRLIEQAEGT
ncbi:MAG: lysophospholipid acyltransferase family protein [Planctomycetota bacterium]|nr:lysophospholipid acyltransferase family protein [Planctomycetota bacterium]